MTFADKQPARFKVDGAPHDWVAHDGQLWFGAGGLLYSIQNKNNRLIAHESVKSDKFGPIPQEHGGLLWVATGDGLFCLANDKFKRIEGIEGTVRGLVDDMDGLLWKGLWVGTTAGLYRLNGETPVRVNISPGEMIEADETDGIVWVAGSNGLFRMDDRIAQSVLASENQCWGLRRLENQLFALTNQGLFTLKGKTTTRIDGDTGRAIDVWMYQGKLWLGATNGFFHIDGNRAVPILLPSGPQPINWARVDNGSLWLAGNKEIFQFDGTALKIAFKASEGETLGSVSPPNTNQFVFGSNKGVYRRVGNGFERTSDKPNRVNNWLPRKDRLWTEMWSVDNRRALYLVDGGQFILAANAFFGAVFGLASADSPPDQRLYGKGRRSVSFESVWANAVTTDSIWIGCTDGLYRIRGYDRSAWNETKLAFVGQPAAQYPPDTPIAIRWKVDDFGQRASRETVQFRVIVSKADGSVVSDAGCDWRPFAADNGVYRDTSCTAALCRHRRRDQAPNRFRSA